METILYYWDMVKDLAVQYAGKVILAVLVLIIGWWLINKLTSSMAKLMEKRDIDISLRPFLKSITKFVLRLLLLISVAGMVGIETTSFIAILGAAGLAIGLALQGSLANFAGGVIILILKPFRAGDFISFSSTSGTVKAIHVFYTYLVTTDNQELVIPNGNLANATITNYSKYDTRRMNMKFKIQYGEDIDKVKKVLDELIARAEGLQEEPKHQIFIENLEENFMVFNVRAWLSTDKYWDVVNSFPETAKKRFDKEGIELPVKAINVQMAKEK